MPGRQDFAIIRSELLVDERAHTAANNYIHADLAVEETALATVVGHIAMLGLWAMRETDDGILPGDAIRAMRFAIPTSTAILTRIRDALLDAKLLKKRRRGYYVVGYTDCYAPIVNKRKADRKRKRKARSSLEMSDGRPRDVHATSDGRPTDVRTHLTRPDHTEPELTKPPARTDPRGELSTSAGAGKIGAGATPGRHAKPKRLTPKAWACVDGILDELAKGSAGDKAQEAALNWRRLREMGALADEVGANILERFLKRFPRAAAEGKRRAGV